MPDEIAPAGHFIYRFSTAVDNLIGSFNQACLRNDLFVTPSLSMVLSGFQKDVKRVKSCRRASCHESDLQMPPRSAHATLQKTVGRYRLLTASVILRNAPHMLGGAADICWQHDVAELCDQYCLSTCLNWLGTRYGFPVYSQAIEPTNQALFDRLSCWPALSDQYPFYVPLPAAIGKNPCGELLQFLEGNLPARLDLIGTIYAQTLSSPLAISDDGEPYIKRERKGRMAGEFYTPGQVVEYCFDRAISKDSFQLMSEVEDCRDDSAHAQCPSDGIFKMLDPACGTGNFLIGVMSWLKARGLSPARRLAFLAKSIYGKDIDGRAISLARVLLLLSVSDVLAGLADKEGSTAVAHLLGRMMQALSCHVQVSDSVIDGCGDGLFHLVSGNPPYISFGARNQPEMPGNWSKFLRRTYPESAQYKVPLTSIFQDLSLRAVRPGGDVVLLLPDAFLMGSYYERLRQRLCRDADIVSLTELPQSTFADATVGRWCVAHYRRRRVAQPDSLGETSFNEASMPAEHQVDLYSLEEVPGNRFAHYRLPQSKLISSDKSRFQLVFNDLDLFLLERLRKLPPLKSLLRGHTGIRSRSGQAAVIAQSPAGAQWRKGLTSGGSIVRHLVCWQGMWIDTSPQGLFAGGHDERIVDQAKILVRQTSDRLIAAVDEEGLYHLNNIHSFVASPGCRGEDSFAGQIYFLEGLINSSFWLYLWRLKSREKGRALAQIDIEMLEQMPLPAPEELAEKMIVALVKRLGTLLKTGVLPSPGKDTEGGITLMQLDRAVDRLVYDMYELDERLIEHIESSAWLEGTCAPFLPCAGVGTRAAFLPARQQVLKLLESLPVESC